MKRGTRATRAIAWSLGASLAAAIAVAVVDGTTRHGGNDELAIVIGELRSRAAESTLVAVNAGRAIDSYVQVQAMQLARRIATARDDLDDVKGGDARVKAQAQGQAEALLSATRRVQALPGKDALAELAAELARIADALLALERAVR